MKIPTDDEVDAWHDNHEGGKTTVVNLRKQPFDVYIGRAGRGHDGLFGNPYSVGSKCLRCGDIHKTPGSTIPCFTDYFENRVMVDRPFRYAVYRLYGKVLGCFCKPKICHGDVISNWLNRSLRRHDGRSHLTETEYNLDLDELDDSDICSCDDWLAPICNCLGGCLCHWEL